MTTPDTSTDIAKAPADSGRPLAETTVKLSAPTLGRILANVTLAASKESSRPILTCALVSYSDGVLTVTATDSYWLLREAVPVSGEGLAFVTLLPVEDLAPVVKAAKGRPAKLSEATVVFDGERVTFEIDSLQVAVRAYEGSFPNVAAIIDGIESTPTASVCFASGLLANICKVVPSAPSSLSGFPMCFTFDGQVKPTRVDWKAAEGSSLFAVVMPVRP